MNTIRWRGRDVVKGSLRAEGVECFFVLSLSTPGTHTHRKRGGGNLTSIRRTEADPRQNDSTKQRVLEVKRLLDAKTTLSDNHF